eukprot:4586162-Pyramimonas_sp.AAC.1
MSQTRGRGRPRNSCSSGALHVTLPSISHLRGRARGLQENDCEQSPPPFPRHSPPPLPPPRPPRRPP